MTLRSAWVSNLKYGCRVESLTDELNPQIVSSRRASVLRIHGPALLPLLSSYRCAPSFFLNVRIC